MTTIYDYLDGVRKRVRDYRKVTGLNLTQISVYAGMSYAALQQFMGGRNLTPKLIYKIEIYLEKETNE